MHAGHLLSTKLIRKTQAAAGFSTSLQANLAKVLVSRCAWHATGLPLRFHHTCHATCWQHTRQRLVQHFQLGVMRGRTGRTCKSETLKRCMGTYVWQTFDAQHSTCECAGRALLCVLGQVVSRQLPVELLHAVHDVKLIITQLITILVLAIGLQGKGYHRQPLASTNQVKVPCTTDYDQDKALLLSLGHSSITLRAVGLDQTYGRGSASEQEHKPIEHMF
jgi:hypothetical protein